MLFRSGSALIGKEKVVINDILTEIAEELEIMPEEERLTLHTDFNEQVIIDGNLSLIGSIFRNLTENAIAYSEGKNIFISLIKNNDTECHIRFEDDGKGVEPEQLPRLFERFYRVDKARSREAGRTGLGLSICSQIVEYYNAQMDIQSEVDKGTSITILFPKKFTV